jgi:hypothetical protein
MGGEIAADDFKIIAIIGLRFALSYADTMRGVAPFEVRDIL